MLDIDGFFKKHGGSILRFEVKVGGQVTLLEFSRDFVLRADRTNPFALQERCDEASSKAATYGTLYVAALAELKEKQREFKSWHGRIHRETKAALTKAINDSGLAYTMKKAPTAEDIENEVMSGPHREELEERQAAIGVFEKTSHQMEILYKCACLDADVSRSMSSMGKSMLERDMIGHGQPRPSTVTGDKKTLHNPDADF